MLLQLTVTEVKQNYLSAAERLNFYSLRNNNARFFLGQGKKKIKLWQNNITRICELCVCERVLEESTGDIVCVVSFNDRVVEIRIRNFKQPTSLDVTRVETGI